MLLLFVFFCALSAPCNGQVRRILCSEGSGNFSSQFTTGVTVTVGPSKSGHFSGRTCDATLQWGKNVLPVARGAWQVDIDVMGADLGLGAPVVAFQIKQSDVDRQMTYEVYSLKKPPRLLRTITGGDYYTAEDVNLEGRNAIWTNDTAAVDGFESLPESSYDFAPTVVLRFEKRQLVDVGSEYQPYFDRQIAELKSQIDARTLAEFKNSDGKLSPDFSGSTEDLHVLRRTKIKVLEIVWAYLYSGREQEAWNVLADLWPPADLGRIRASLQEARDGGILRQVDRVSNTGSVARRKRKATIFNMVTENKQRYDEAHSTLVPDGMGGMVPSGGSTGARTPTTVDIGPKAIYLGIPVLKSEKLVIRDSKVFLNLVIDAAGKVRSAEVDSIADAGLIGAIQVNASSAWNFIPAFKAGRAVACRMRLGVSLEQ